MHFSFFRGDLPPACSLAFTTGATGGYPGGVLLRIRAASDQGPGSSLYLRGRRCTAAPNGAEPPNTARTAASAALGTPPTCHSGTLRIVRMALLTEPVPRSVRQV